MSCALLATIARFPYTEYQFPILKAVVPLIGIIVVAAMAIAFVQRWRKRAEPERISPSDELSRFRVLYEAGELTAEEFERIRAKLGAKLKQQLDLPPGTVAGATGSPGPVAEATAPSPGPGPNATQPPSLETNVRPSPPEAL